MFGQVWAAARRRCCSQHWKLECDNARTVLIFHTSAMYFVKTNGRSGKIFHTERVLIFITPAASFQEMYGGSVNL